MEKGRVCGEEGTTAEEGVAFGFLGGVIGGRGRETDSKELKRGVMTRGDSQEVTGNNRTDPMGIVPSVRMALKHGLLTAGASYRWTGKTGGRNEVMFPCAVAVAMKLAFGGKRAGCYLFLSHCASLRRLCCCGLRRYDNYGE